MSGERSHRAELAGVRSSADTLESPSISCATGRSDPCPSISSADGHNRCVAGRQPSAGAVLRSELVYCGQGDSTGQKG